jgi:hypothetical protein
MGRGWGAPGHSPWAMYWPQLHFFSNLANSSRTIFHSSKDNRSLSAVKGNQTCCPKLIDQFHSEGVTYKPCFATNFGNMSSFTTLLGSTDLPASATTASIAASYDPSDVILSTHGSSLKIWNVRPSSKAVVEHLVTDFAHADLLHEITFGHQITSISLSKAERNLLVILEDGTAEIHCFEQIMFSNNVSINDCNSRALSSFYDFTIYSYPESSLPFR